MAEESAACRTGMAESLQLFHLEELLSQAVDRRDDLEAMESDACSQLESECRSLEQLIRTKDASMEQLEQFTQHRSESLVGLRAQLTEESESWQREKGLLEIHHAKELTAQLQEFGMLRDHLGAECESLKQRHGDLQIEFAKVSKVRQQERDHLEMELAMESEARQRDCHCLRGELVMISEAREHERISMQAELAQARERFRRLCFSTTP